jgi:hypothetical protein
MFCGALESVDAALTASVTEIIWLYSSILASPLLAFYSEIVFNLDIIMITIYNYKNTKA